MEMNTMINQDRLVNSFMEYVQIGSPSGKEKEFADFIEGELKNLGLEVYRDKSREFTGSNTGSIMAKFKGSNNDRSPILFSCHLDTVTPAIGIKPLIRDGVIYSDGTTILGADNKAGIATVIEALRVVAEENIDHGTIELVFSTCEEVGLLGAKHLEYDRLESKRAFVLDSDGKPGEVIVQGPGQDNISAKILGKAAHAGVAPEEGISAIKIAAQAINNMNLFRIDEETTANIGIIQGGEATNIITPEVNIWGEARSLNEDKLNKQSQHMKKVIEDVSQENGGKAEVNVTREYHAYKIEESDEIVDLVRKVSAKLNLDFQAKGSGGGSDTNIFNQKGIKAINLAIGERKPHTLEEHIYIEDLENAAKLILGIIKLG